MLDELNDPTHGGITGEDRKSYQIYNNLIRYQNDSVVQFFPCLQKPIQLPTTSSDMILNSDRYSSQKSNASISNTYENNQQKSGYKFGSNHSRSNEHYNSSNKKGRTVSYE